MYSTLLAAVLLLGTQEPAETFHGVVTDADGAPVAGAKVVLGTPLARPDEVSETRTDDEGRFSVSPVVRAAGSGEPARTWSGSLVVHKPGWALGGVLIHSGTPRDEPLRITLRRPRPVSVRLVDPDGRPVAGARLSLFNFRDAQRYLIAETLLGEVVSFATDDDGRVTLDMLSEEAVFSLSATTDAYGQQHLYFPEGKPDHTFPLRRAGRVVGRVTADDPAAVRGLEVSVSSSVPVVPGQTQASVSGGARVRTDAEGRFEIAAIAEGMATVSVAVDRASPLRAERPTVELEAGETAEVTVALVPATLVRGTVVDRDTEQPLAGVAVNVHNQSGDSHNLMTGEDGAFEAHVGPGQVWARVSELPAMYLSPIEGGRGGMIEPGMEELTLDAIRLSRGGSIRGTVVDENGAAVAGAWVTAAWTQREGSTSTTASLSTKTDSEGAFVLEPVTTDAELALRSETRERASGERTSLPPGHAEPIQLTITPEGVAPVAARVVDDHGQPVADAQVTIRGGARTLGSGRRWQSGPEFDNEWKLTTDADGRFATPHPLPRLANATVTVEREGMIRHQASFEPGSTDPQKTLGEIVLKRVLRIAGRVIDSEGRPVAGASVFTHGMRQYGGMVSATTDDQGRFVLEEAHPDARLLFARKDGFRFAGTAMPRDRDGVTMTMTRADEPPGEALATRRLPDEQREKLLKTLLLPVYERQQDRPSDYFRREILEMLVPQDRQFALDRLIDLGTPSARSELLLALGETEDALAQAGEIQNAYSRTYAFFKVADATQDPAARHKILGDALLHARGEPNPARRVVLFRGVAGRLLEIGQREAGEAVVADALEPASQLPTTDWAGFARGHFAETLALVDLDAALALVGELEEEQARDRHHGNIAHKLAGTHPAEAERVLTLVKRGWTRDGYARRLCYRMAPVDLPRARRLAAEIEESTVRAHAWGVMAMALREREPEAARELLRQAFDEAESAARGAQARQQIFPIAAVLVRYSESVDPAATAEYVWRAAALHPGPHLDFFGYDQRDVERDAQTGRLLLLLGLYGVAPDILRELADPMFERAERYQPQQVYHRAPSVYAGLGAVDPQRAVAWHARFLEKVDDDRLRIISPPQAWRVLAALLAPDPDETWRFLQREIFHAWVIDTEDL